MLFHIYNLCCLFWSGWKIQSFLLQASSTTIKKTIFWKSMSILWPHDKLPTGGLGGYINCCEVNNSIIHTFRWGSSVITQCRKLNIRQMSKSFCRFGLMRLQKTQHAACGNWGSDVPQRTVSTQNQLEEAVGRWKKKNQTTCTNGLNDNHANEQLIASNAALKT